MTKLEEINEKLKVIDSDINALYDKQRIIEEEYDSEREKILLEPDSPLRENAWTLKLNSKTYKLYLDDCNRDGFKKLFKLYCTDNHCYYNIFNKYSLVYNDSELTISANSNSDLIELIKIHNLKIINTVGESLNDINNKIKELETAKETISNILKDI